MSIRAIGNGDGSFSIGSTVGYGTSSTHDTLSVADLNGDGVKDVFGFFREEIRVFIADATETSIAADAVSLATREDALQTLTDMRGLGELIARRRAEIGAGLSRLETAARAQQAFVSAAAEAESRINDADVASDAA